MQAKICRKCGESKPHSEFHKQSLNSDGLHRHCKVCRNAYMGKWRRENPEVWAAAHRRWAEKNINSAYLASSRWQKANPEKVRAITALNHALQAGKVERWPCEVCGESKVEAHHADYSNVLGVTWLCSSHHKLLHREHSRRIIENAPISQSPTS